MVKMIDQSFNYKQFKKLQRLGDFNSVNNNLEQLNEKLQNLEFKLLNIENYKFSKIKRFCLNNKNIYCLDDNNDSYIEDDFILRKINQNIKRIFSVKQSDRNVIIKQIENLLNEKQDCHIYRLDIQTFYESISKNIVVNKVLSSSLVSAETKLLLKTFFNELNDISGLPRGLNISATLSELYMKSFDKKIISMEGVYYYARFVDDIIVFSFKNIPFENFENLLKNNNALLLNKQKSRVYNVDFNKNISIEYLGYEFIVDKKKKLTINVSKKKLSKIKTKFILSLIDYKKNNDFKLLKNRLLFLTTTYPIKSSRQKISKYKDLGYLQAGIFFNYSNISSDSDSLANLDKFVRNVLFSNNKYSKSLTNDQKRELAKISFVASFNRKITRNYFKDFNKIKRIMRCWKYV